MRVQTQNNKNQESKNFFKKAKLQHDKVSAI